MREKLTLVCRASKSSDQIKKEPLKNCIPWQAKEANEIPRLLLSLDIRYRKRNLKKEDK